MKNIIPYEKDIKFDTKIAEITSISLEHNEKRENDELIGNFIVSGSYKSHQISVNSEDFLYKIPFSIELSDKVDINSISIDINDFTYDIKDNDTLVIKIELSFEYDEVEKESKNTEIEPDNIELLDSLIEERENEDKNVEEAEIIENENENKILKSNDNILNNNIFNENTYVTYHIYIVGKEDTIESICQKYNVNKDILKEYNNFEEIKIGDKLLIPVEDNE